MKAMLWLLLGIVVGGGAGWYLHELTVQDVRASTNFRFNDNLAAGSLSQRGRKLARWRLGQQDQHSSDHLLSLRDEL
jgi:hypothetical protein